MTRVAQGCSACLLISVLLLCVCLVQCREAEAKLVIEDNGFVWNGQPIRLLSASIHYSRVPRTLWRDRLLRLRSIGLNTIQTYVFWNFHQSYSPDDEPNWTGQRDLPAFLSLAHELGFLVLLRAGPYGCGEWDLGGFPAFMLNQEPPLVLRTSQPAYLKLVDQWWDRLLPVVAQFLQAPVVAVQVENEYGSYGSDHAYIEHLVARARYHLGPDVILYTTDGANEGMLSKGTLNGSAVYSVVDFGPGTDVTQAFALQAKYNAPGMSPPLCSEFYSGWLTHWGEPMANKSSTAFASALTSLLDFSPNASFSMYMGHGGTNFEFWNGANADSSTSVKYTITSYDYDSPVSEAGQHNYGSDGVDKYIAVRDVLAKYVTSPIPAEPEGPSMGVVAKPVVLSDCALQATWADSDVFPINVLSKPMTFEALNLPYGYMYYRAKLPPRVTVGGKTCQLSIQDVHDRAWVDLDGVAVGVLDRDAPMNISLANVSASATLGILVENRGRINYGHQLYDQKGITRGVFLDGVELSGKDVWQHTQMAFSASQVYNLKYTPCPNPVSPGAHGTAVMLTGTFVISSGVTNITSTYLNMSAWGHGSAFVNGFNVGRYDSLAGPQKALFVPYELLHFDGNPNSLHVWETARVPTTPSVSFSDVPILH